MRLHTHIILALLAVLLQACASRGERFPGVPEGLFDLGDTVTLGLARLPECERIVVHESPGYVNNVDGGRNGALGMAYFGEDLQTAVRNIGGTQIGLDSAEGEVGTLGLAAAHAVEESGFTHIRKAYYTAF